MFKWGKNNKTVKELRRRKSFTARELAAIVKVDTIVVLRVDDLKLKDVPEPLKSRLTSFL